jgi:protein phosphatase
MRLEAAGATDRGRIRDNNEDAFWIDADSGLFLVADGMGGLAAGEVASRLAVETVARIMANPSFADTLEYAPPGSPDWQPAQIRLSRAVSEANQAIVNESRARFGASGNPGIGSTLVGLWRCDAGFVLTNVGDSRAYLYREGTLSTLSEDHSLVMAQVRQGLLSLDEAARSPERHVIYRALGMSATVEADFTPLSARAGDLYLLCSDGLTDVVDDAALARLLAELATGALDDACRQLIEEALRRLSRDNVTVVLVRVAPEV